MIKKDRRNEIYTISMRIESIMRDKVFSQLTSEPGANISTHWPKFEKDDLLSPSVVDPTAHTLSALAKDWSHASLSLFPAETATKTPLFQRSLAALSAALFMPPPILKLATHFPSRDLQSVAAHSIPAMASDHQPLPLQSRTIMETMSTPGAIPNVFPPMVPATICEMYHDITHHMKG